MNHDKEKDISFAVIGSISNQIDGHKKQYYDFTIV